MSWSTSAKGPRDQVRHTIKQGAAFPDMAVSRAMEDLMDLFAQGGEFSVSTNGHINPDGFGGATVSVSVSAPMPAPVPAPPVEQPPDKAPGPLSTDPVDPTDPMDEGRG